MSYDVLMITMTLFKSKTLQLEGFDIEFKSKTILSLRLKH